MGFPDSWKALETFLSLEGKYVLVKWQGLKDALDKRRRRAEMALSIIAPLISPVRTTKGGGPYV